MDLITMVLACSLYTDNSIVNAMVQVGSKNNPLIITPAGGSPKTFKTPSQAMAYTVSELQQGHPLDIGLMQVPSRWLEGHNISADELFAPCKNLVVATQILNNAADRCNELQANQSADDLKACTLSMYKTGDPQNGLEYAHTVMDYAKAHSFDDILAAAKKKNPKEFTMLPHLPPKKEPPRKVRQVQPNTDDEDVGVDSQPASTSPQDEQQ